jgi:hypothetical protein
MEVNSQLDAPAILPRMKVPWYSLNMRLDGPQRRPGHFGEETNLMPLRYRRVCFHYWWIL